MVGRKPVMWALLAVVFAYCVYPYVALYRLGEAVRQGDAVTLAAMVNWNSVRDGIKEDICDLVIDQPQSASDNALPAFGAGFVRGIATNMIDRRVTPEALVEATQQTDTVPSTGSMPMHVSWAFFISPSAFQVDLTSPGQAEPVRLRMDLRAGAWRVTRVWLPLEMLGQANTRT